MQSRMMKGAKKHHRRQRQRSGSAGQGRRRANEGGSKEASSTSEPAASLTCRPCAPFSTVGLLMIAQTSEYTQKAGEVRN